MEKRQMIMKLLNDKLRLNINEELVNQLDEKHSYKSILNTVEILLSSELEANDISKFSIIDKETLMHSIYEKHFQKLEGKNLIDPDLFLFKKLVKLFL